VHTLAPPPQSITPPTPPLSHLTGLVSIDAEGGDRATRVTFTVQWSGKGNLPPWAMRTEIVRTLSVVNELRTEVQRDDEIDAAELAKLAKVMTKNQQTYTRQEIVTLSLSLGDAKFQELDSSDHFVKMEQKPCCYERVPLWMRQWRTARPPRPRK